MAPYTLSAGQPLHQTLILMGDACPVQQSKSLTTPVDCGIVKWDRSLILTPPPTHHIAYSIDRITNEVIMISSKRNRICVFCAHAVCDFSRFYYHKQTQVAPPMNRCKCSEFIDWLLNLYSWPACFSRTLHTCLEFAIECA